MRRVAILGVAALGVLALGVLAGCGQGGGTGSGSASPGGEKLVASDPAIKPLLADLPAAYQSADLVNGRQEFAQCRTCHTVVKDGPNMTGPNLYGVFGRKAATQPSFAYSAAMKASGIEWDVDHLDKWLAEPRAMVPDTKMSFMGVKDPNSRRDLIAYLKVATSGGPM